ncbi:MAG: carboxypeptidase-like regulatory domain-containing protein [Burkholderiales bacterium]|jgi:hypothetical protein
MKQAITVVCLILGLTGFISNASAEIEIHDQQGVRYVTGGMTEDERDEMNKLASRFPMHIVMIDHAKQHQPIKGVEVVVRDVSGNVLLQARSEGPLMFVDVIGGRYTVEAEYDGEKQTETKDLTGRRYLRLRFTFNE